MHSFGGVFVASRQQQQKATAYFYVALTRLLFYDTKPLAGETASF